MYTLDEAAAPTERSWLLHTVVLPACMISPLWMRFLQCLRQCYETRQRWPYLGNAMKYMIAAEVALFGAFDPSKKNTFLWMAGFFVATLYQVFWDVFMDWELFLVKFNVEQEEDIRDKKGIGSSTYQSQQSSTKGRIKMSVALREKRLYSYKSMYYLIFVINFMLRFFWTLSLLPANHLSRSGKLVEQFGNGIQHFVLPMIAVAEIIRRTIWGFLRVELQAIKVSEQKEQEQQTMVGTEEYNKLHQDMGMNLAQHNDSYDMTLDDMQPMHIRCTGERGLKVAQIGFFQPFTLSMFVSDMSSATEMQVLGELCLWATVFMCLGIFAAAHRQ